MSSEIFSKKSLFLFFCHIYPLYLAYVSAGPSLTTGQPGKLCKKTRNPLCSERCQFELATFAN